VEKVQQFRLLHELWTAENGLLTPTLKLRREVLFANFAAEIEAMYAPGGKRLQERNEGM